MSASNQQTLADSGAFKRPPMLEKGNYIPWESRFRRFIDNKLKEGERIPDPDCTTKQIIEPLSKMTKINKKQYIADVRVMNYLLQAIPNDIYNSVDACKTAQEMWERIKRLMYGSDITNHVRHSRLMDEFDKFTANEGESLEYVYERLTTLWSKYVTMVRHNQTGDTVSFDQLYDSLVQFKPHVQASKGKRAVRNHEPLALIVHLNASSSQSHASPSYSHSPQPYYVTHPSSVIDYKEDYQGELQGDSQEDKLTTIMMLLARAITQKNAGRQNRNQTFNAGNGLTQNDESNQIVQRVPRTESNPGKANVKCYNCKEKGHYARDCQKPRVRDAKYFREQMLLATKDEARSNLKDEENDFMLDNSYEDKTLEELTAAIITMARIQPADDNDVTEQNYDAKAVSEANASHKMIPKGVHEHKNHGKRKTVVNTLDDDQIDSNIIFNDHYVENNGGSVEHDSNAHDQYHDVKILAYNV
ncbi:putative ribonuclease H-like domain-containing protein [Tanacetum coccineum]